MKMQIRRLAKAACQRVFCCLPDFAATITPPRLPLYPPWDNPGLPLRERTYANSVWIRCVPNRRGSIRPRDTILGFSEARHCYPLSCGMPHPIRPVRRDKRKRGSGQGIRRFGSRSTQEGMPPPSRQNQDQSRNLTFNADFRHYPPPNLLDIWQYERKLA